VFIYRIYRTVYYRWGECADFLVHRHHFPVDNCHFQKATALIRVLGTMFCGDMPFSNPKGIRLFWTVFSRCSVAPVSASFPKEPRILLVFFVSQELL
jgi:hypothetical protein